MEPHLLAHRARAALAHELERDNLVCQSAADQRIQLVCNRRIQSNLANELKHFVPAEEIQQASRLLGQLIDGIWVRAGMLPDQMTSDDAIEEMVFATTKLLASDEISQAKHREALKKVKGVATIVFGSKAFRERLLQG